MGNDVFEKLKHFAGFMPHDLVVVRDRDADEAGDYRVMQHMEAVGHWRWQIMPDWDAQEFLRD